MANCDPDRGGPGTRLDYNRSRLRADPWVGGAGAGNT